MFALVAAGTAVGSLYSVPDGRYAFLPAVLFLFLLLANLDIGGSVRFLTVSGAICLYLSNGVLRYRDFVPLTGTPPQWTDEVRLWRRDHRHDLSVWPSFWTARVNLRPLLNGSSTAAGPSPVSVTPSHGAGASARFRLTYEEADGFKALSYVHLLINSEVKGPGSCWIYYQPPDNTLWLVNDTQTANLGPLRPGTVGTVGNSQCVIDAAGSSVSGTRELLTVNVDCRFKSSFAGKKRLYLDAQSLSATSNWKYMGTWTVPGDQK
jgi:hypothetical protein